MASDLVDKEIEFWLEKHLEKEIFRESPPEAKEFLAKSFKRHRQSLGKVIVIGGTNGKGHVSFFLSKFLSASGKRVACLTSPHIFTLRERFRFNHKLVAKDLLLKTLSRCLEKKNEFQLSYYEFLVFVFLELFPDELFDYTILEVGLGGRLDSVNLAGPDLTVITSIGRDHTEFLGNNLSDILMEKLGITRSEVPLFSGITQKSLIEQMDQYCLKNNIPLIQLRNEDKSYWERNESLGDLLLTHLGVERKEENIEIDRGPGRFQKLTRNGVHYTLLGAHNLDGMRSAVTFLIDSNQRFDAVILGLSKRDRKSLKYMIEAWEKSPCLYKKIFLTTFDHHRALQEEDALFLIDGMKNVKLLSYIEAKSLFTTGEKVLICGSNYFFAPFFHS